jgi:hypothetical protein
MRSCVGTVSPRVSTTLGRFLQASRTLTEIDRDRSGSAS